MDLHEDKTLDETELKIISMALDDQLFTNAEIADRIGGRVPFVRDVIDDYFGTTSCNATSVPNWRLGPSKSKRMSEYEIKTEYNKITQTTDGVTDENTNKNGSCEYRPGDLFSSLPNPVVETEFWGDEPIVRRANAAFINTFGYDNIVGENLTELILPKECHSITEIAQESQPREHTEHIVKRRTSTGVQTFLHHHLPYEDKGEQYAFEVYVDISNNQYQSVEVKNRDKQFKMKAKQAEYYNTILLNELRPRINHIMGYFNEKDVQKPGLESCDIELVLENMRKLIDRTITLTENTELVSETDLVSIENLANSAWTVVDTGDSNLDITKKFKLQCHAGLCLQLLVNLFQNSVQHNDSPVSVRIGVHDEMKTTTRDDTQNSFYVADNGCGISEGKKSKLFEIGETDFKQRAGLGLTIVQQIVEAHQWDIELVESSDGGCKFIISNVDFC